MHEDPEVSFLKHSLVPQKFENPCCFHLPVLSQPFRTISQAYRTNQPILQDKPAGSTGHCISQPYRTQPIVQDKQPDVQDIASANPTGQDSQLYRTNQPTEQDKTAVYMSAILTEMTSHNFSVNYPLYSHPKQ